ncbi:MAG: ATP-dependent DNA ligase [Candidatus Nanoarchaeia archaeon]|nr:ATP-dependent DNA ligase [Candidatus Nanoarchaeia archaeon]MDD5357983.1 ATP-dependent DNA ligase [Candidatus Nanoarchaeia archaeon]MDD5588902.1 ATP-dependent DNA ligase [Candidatus Nanoarchaeia archaeon]
MRYLKLAELYESVSSTTKRLEKIEILSDFLKHLDASDREVLYLLLGNIYPDYDERKIGISSQLAIKAISKATGTNKEKVVKEWKSLGDLGKVAEKLTKTKKQHTLESHILTTAKVLENLRKLPALEGKGTIDKKISLITELLTSASPVEALYLVRTLIGDLRIGIQVSTIRESMAHAFFRDEKEGAKKVQEAIDKSNDVASIFDIVKKGKTSELGKVKIEIGKPIKAMLAQKAKNVKEGFDAVGKPCAIEYKYDGFRLIIHKKGNQIILFTRRLENVTKQFPEVADYIRKYVKADSAILDSEAVGFDKKTKEYKPFQSISQRIRRKYDIEKLQEELPVEINVFDILYYNGKSLLNEPFRKRTELIRKIIEPHPYKIIHSKQIITEDENKANEFYRRALKDNQEGVMMKNLDAEYNPGSRVGHMLKIKPEEKDFDLVITGAEYGTGKRSGWLSSFIISCLDKNKNKFLEIGKVGTGFKEKKEEGFSFEELTEKIKPLITEEKGKNVKIKPKIVISITYQEIQKSPTYSSGFALRFPRFTALRPDRSPSDITTLKEVEKDFENQKRNWKYG